MSDLIRRNALKSYIDCGHMRPPTEICFSELDVVRMLDRMPTIDAVEVVRCKDCMYKSLMRCCPYQINGFKVTPDWYCPMGVKEDT